MTDIENTKDRGILTDAHAAMVKDRAGKPYRPSNGFEGDLFQEAYCEDCEHFKGTCMIYGSMYFFEVGEPEYPKEIVYGADGQPTCTGFQEAREPLSSIKGEG